MKIKRKYLIVFLFLFSLVFHSVSQQVLEDSTNLRLKYNRRLGFCIGGPNFLSINYEHFLNHNFSIEVGAGSVLLSTGAHIGARFYFGKRNKPSKIAPYFGGAFGAQYIIGGSGYGGFGGYGAAVGYIPVGIQFLNKNGSAVSFEGGVMFLDNEVFPMGAIRINLGKEENKSASTKTSKKEDKIPKEKPQALKTEYKSYSIGVNLFSLFKPNFMQEVQPDLFFASNRNVDFFFQKEKSKKFAWRFPLRIGFNSGYDWVSSVNEKIYKEAAKTIIGDLGVEPIFYRNVNKKLNLLVVPSFCLGVGRKISTQSLSELYNLEYQYTAGGSYFYGKLGCSIGMRWNFTKDFHIGMEYGAYFANNFFRQSPYLGLSGKCFVIYQFGGK